MVPRKKTTPMAMRTIGPDIERGGRGGVTCTGLTIADLARRHLNVGAHRASWSRWRREGWRRRRRLALQQLRDADGEKQQRPGAVPARTVHVLEKRKNPYGHQNNRGGKA